MTEPDTFLDIKTLQKLRASSEDFRQLVYFIDKLPQLSYSFASFMKDPEYAVPGYLEGFSSYFREPFKTALLTAEAVKDEGGNPYILDGQEFRTRLNTFFGYFQKIAKTFEAATNTTGDIVRNPDYNEHPLFVRDEEKNVVAINLTALKEPVLLFYSMLNPEHERSNFHRKNILAISDRFGLDIPPDGLPTKEVMERLHEFNTAPERDKEGRPALAAAALAAFRSPPPGGTSWAAGITPPESGWKTGV